MQAQNTLANLAHCNTKLIQNYSTLNNFCSALMAILLITSSIIYLTGESNIAFAYNYNIKTDTTAKNSASTAIFSLDNNPLSLFDYTTYNSTMLAENELHIFNSTPYRASSPRASIRQYGAYASVSGAGNHILINNTLSIADTILSTADAIFLFGAYAKAGTIGIHGLTGNKLFISNASLNASSNIGLFGASAAAGESGGHNLTGNILSIDSNTNIIAMGQITLAAAYARTSNTTGTGIANHTDIDNLLSITGTNKITANNSLLIFGAYAENSTTGNHTLTNNTLFIDGNNTFTASTNMPTNSTITMYGAYATATEKGNHTLIGNTVSITGNNTFTALTDMSASTPSLLISGAYAQSITTDQHTLTNNTVSISGKNTFTAKESIVIYGAHAEATRGTLNLTDNLLSITGYNTISSTSGGVSIYGASANSTLPGSSNLTRNRVLITGNNRISSTSGDINIIATEGLSDVKYFAANNHILIDGNNTFSSINGAVNIYAAKGKSNFNDEIYKFTSNSISITGNNTFSSGSSNVSIVGSFTNSFIHTTTAADNTISISGDNILSSTTGDVNIYGAQAIGNGSFTFINNTINISGNLSLNASAGAASNLAGSCTNTTAIYDSDFRTGNILHLNKATVTLLGGTATVSNFEKYIFTPNFDQTTPMLTAKNIELGTNATLALGAVSDISNTGAQGLNTLALGAEINLMSGIISGNFVNINDTIQLRQGISILYDTKAIMSATALKIRVVNTSTQAQAKVPAESQAASVAFLNQAANLMSGAAIDNAQTVTQASSKQVYRQVSANSIQESRQTPKRAPWAAFGAFNGGKSRYTTGSYADIDGFSLVTGLAKNSNLSPNNDLLFAVFLEYGQANIDTQNIFSTHTVNSYADGDYYGAGLFARFNYRSKLYTDVSLRVGLNEIHQTSFEYAAFRGRDINYFTDTVYYGTHLALGYLLDITDNNGIDIYGKYFWTHQNGDSAAIAGDLFNFDAINSHRTRLGARYSYDLLGYVKPYIGAAWEYEFNGDAKYSVYGITAGIPSLAGSTGIFELGITITIDAIGLSADFAVEAYAGVREGTSGKIQLAYTF